MANLTVKNVDVLLCFDKNFILATGALMTSILENNQDRFFYFHVCMPDADKKAVGAALSRLHSRYPQRFALLFYSFESFNGYEQIAKSVNARMAAQCVRLFLGQIPHYHNDTIIYVDSDVICRRSLNELINTTFDTPILATQSPDKEIMVYGHKVRNYFWSGLMVVNVPLWQKQCIEEQAVDFVVKHKPKFPDQDALNVVLNNNWQALSNYDWHSMWEIKPDTIFLHYVAGKPWFPWHFKGKLNEVNLFRQYAKIFEPDVTKWISFRQDKKVFINLSVYSARFATKWMAKLMFKRRCYKAALYFYLRHLQVKVKQKGIIGIILLRSNSRT